MSEQRWRSQEGGRQRMKPARNVWKLLTSASGRRQNRRHEIIAQRKFCRMLAGGGAEAVFVIPAHQFYSNVETVHHETTKPVCHYALCGLFASFPQVKHALLFLQHVGYNLPDLGICAGRKCWCWVVCCLPLRGAEQEACRVHIWLAERQSMLPLWSHCFWLINHATVISSKAPDLDRH